jgi:hypothetical protein
LADGSCNTGNTPNGTFVAACCNFSSPAGIASVTGELDADEARWEFNTVYEGGFEGCDFGVEFCVDNTLPASTLVTVTVTDTAGATCRNSLSLGEFFQI